MTDAPRKTEFYWASVAGADPEPVEVTTKDGKRVAYTIGCPDPFELDDRSCPVILGRLATEVKFGESWRIFAMDDPHPLVRPELPRTVTPALVAAEKAWAKIKSHSWRGPR